MNRFKVGKVNEAVTKGGSSSPRQNETTAIDVPELDATPEGGKQNNGITSKAINLIRKASRISLTGGGDNSNDPARKFSLAQLARETLPREDNYRQSMRSPKRPSIGELRGEISEPIQESQTNASNTSKSGHTGVKLGWIVGVMIPCLLNIWGVMLFLRLTWVVGQSGLIESLIVIGISTVVCVVTTLSLSAISTNGEVKGGGIYFIISRSLGPEFGASVGIVFAFANAVAASMNTIGFCESLNNLLRKNDLKIIDNSINDIRIIGCITILVLILICCIGMEWESKAQNFLIAVIVIAIANFLVGASIGPQGSTEIISKGFTGFQTQNFIDNLGPGYTKTESFFSVFAIFFPSVTGLQAGANISGDLKDPSEAIPKGTLLALGISMFSYALFAVFAGGAAVRDASGNISDVVNGTIIGSNLECTLDASCKYGLRNDYEIAQLMSGWDILIYAGCFAATLSTALTNLLSVPRLIQALGVDGIYPGLIFFSKPYGKHGEPYRGYVLTFFISCAFVLIAELNVIAPLISNFYLASYALINFCTFHAAFVKPLGWRPTFRYYNVWLSLIGFILCVTIMFLIHWLSSLITLVIIFALYLIVMYRKPDVNWGSTTQAQMYKTALTAAYRLQSVSEHVKNYHPQILVLAGDPLIRPPLTDLAHLITKHSSLMIVGNILPLKISYKTRQGLLKLGQNYLRARKIKAFYTIVDGLMFEDGVNALLKVTGFGKMAPNIVLMGYKSDWLTCRREELVSYFNILQNSFSCRMGVAILRLPDGLDFSDLQQEIRPINGVEISNFNKTVGEMSLNTHSSVTFNVQHENYPNNFLQTPTPTGLVHVDSNLNLSEMVSCKPTEGTNSITYCNEEDDIKKIQNVSSHIVYSTRGGSVVPKHVLDALNVFKNKQPKNSFIDVWWLYDDGGLTMLLPYIISLRSSWSQCKLRIFGLPNRRNNLEIEEKNMRSLLKKFRINFTSLTMLEGVTDKPKQITIDKHDQLINNFREGTHRECYVSVEEKEELEHKTYRQLRIHELIVEHSSNSSLIVMSLPMPRQEGISAPLYMSWLEMLTSELKCPVLLARGNQFPVLTFYS